MTSSVRRRIDVIETESGGHQPGVEPRDVAADHADRGLVEMCDQLASRVDRITRLDRPIGESWSADSGRSNDQCVWVDLVEANETDAAVVQGHATQPAVLRNCAS